MIARIAATTGTSPLEVGRLDSVLLEALDEQARRITERADWLAEMTAQGVERIHELLRLTFLAHFKGDAPDVYEVRRPWDTEARKPRRPGVVQATAGQAAGMIGAEVRGRG